MLVISRRPGEAVLIGPGVEVTVIDVTTSRVRLGFEAPAKITILRKEIQIAAAQNLAAADAVSPSTVGLLLDTLRKREVPK